MADLASDATAEGEIYRRAKGSKFEFKPESSKRSKRRHSSYKAEGSHSSKRRRSGEGAHSNDHRHSRRKHKQHHGADDVPTNRNGEYDNPEHRHRESVYDGLVDNEAASPLLDPDAAFRESLFDAMADDEGAEYWESVYGQPLHVYPNTKPGPEGTLERMSDEEYAEYVRMKMWEKSHQHIMEERAARERRRKKKKEQQRESESFVAAEEAERESVRRQMEESLRRGEERKKAREMQAAWAQYVSNWELLRTSEPSRIATLKVHDAIPWPVASGKAKSVDKDAIERFLGASDSWKDDAVALLKLERVRWHPDKMQQRFGQHIDSETMRLVTVVFQVIDQLWNERRGRST